MSFILDALKKSESARQRQSGPSLFEVKVAPPRRALPVWAVALGVLLAVNVVIISWMLLRHPAVQQPATPGNPPAAAPPPASSVAATSGERPATAPEPEPATSSGTASSSPASGGTASSGPAVPRVAAPAASAVAPAASAVAPPASSGQVRAAAPPASGSAQTSGQPSAADAPSDEAPAVDQASAPGAGASGDSGQDLPLYQQIVSSAGLPELHLDLHVFAQRPQDRFAMINMHRVGEGDSLPSGARVESIRPDGVVLSYHGTRFLLPRN